MKNIRNIRNTRNISKIKSIFVIFLMMIFALNFITIDARAEVSEELPMDVVISNGAATWRVTDSSYQSAATLNAGDTITIKTKEKIQGIYLVWDQPVEVWTLKYNKKEVKQGENGFLHDYISFDEEVTEFTICTDTKNTLAEVKCFGVGELPSNIQVWEPSCEKADILILSSHADDEILFFGGILPYYAGVLDLEVQVVYFSQYWTGQKIREHEKLDGLWNAGVRNYPYNGHFDDLYASDLEPAKQLFGYDNTVAFIVEMLRKFKPQVAFSQDLNGEYGHGTHKLIAYGMVDAVEVSNDPTKYPESAEKYGVHEVKKMYLHLYENNQIKLDCRTPLDEFGGKTALEVLQDSYKLHVSQQWCWFYVDDEYEYSCAKFGLYYTNVGYDTGNDIMENIKDYKTQEEERIKAEEESKRLEEESIRESMSIAEAESIKESMSIAEAESIKEAEILKEKEQKETTNRLITIGIIAAIVLVVSVGILVVRQKQKAKKRAAAKRRKKRRVAEQKKKNK